MVLPAFLLAIFGFLIMVSGPGCGIYGFKEKTTLPDSIKTVKVNFIENRANYVNPQLSPTLTEKLKQKIINQTRLTQTNGDDAHYDIKGYISDYSPSTVGITSTNGRSQTSINRLTVTVHIILTKQSSDKPPEEFDVSRSFDFSANKTLQSAEGELLDEMIRNLTDEIFNHIFSAW